MTFLDKLRRWTLLEFKLVVLLLLWLFSLPLYWIGRLGLLGWIFYLWLLVEFLPSELCLVDGLSVFLEPVEDRPVPSIRFPDLSYLVCVGCLRIEAASHVRVAGLPLTRQGGLIAQDRHSDEIYDVG